MSRYLNRLTLSAQMTNKRQSLQPLIRSRSPIADHDQRIGIPDWEGVDFDRTSLIDAENQENISSDTRSPSITAVNHPSDPMVQRKITDSSPSSPVPSFFFKGQPEPSIGEKTPPQTNIPALPAIAQPVLSDSLFIPTESPKNLEESRELANFVQEDEQKNPSCSNILAKPSDSPALIPLSSNASEGVIETEQEFASPMQKKTELKTILSLNPPPSGKLNEVRLRTVGEKQPVAIPSLNPSPPLRVDASQSLEPFSDREKVTAPNVVISRINVEVVPPPTVEISKMRSPSEPLTAASVSVIGPLGNNVRPSVRFSLRQKSL